MDNEKKIHKDQIPERVQEEVMNLIDSGIMFQETNQRAVNPELISKIEVPLEDINIKSYGSDFTIIDFIVVVTYINEAQFSMPGIANFKVDRVEFPKVDEILTYYTVFTNKAIEN